MDIKADIERIGRDAVAARLSDQELCERAGIAVSTWWRIRQTGSSRLSTLEKLENAIKAKRREAEQAA